METITITISAQTLAAIGVGLQELPFKIANPAINEIDLQVQAHIKAKTNEGSSKGTGSA